MNALGKRTFKSDRLKDVAIQWAFWKELKEAIKTLWKHIANIPQSLLREYAEGLHWSWNNGKPNQVFQFLLEQADQGDLDMAKKQYAYKNYEEFRLAIDKAFKAAPPAGSRIISVEKVQRVLAVLAPIPMHPMSMDQAASSRTIYSVRQKRQRKCEGET